jgi:predicted ATPase/DNA-binding XRE family transcriptional regulator
MAGILGCVVKGTSRGATPEQGASFGMQLRRLREAAGLTQEELASRAGLSAMAVSVLERGERRRPYPHTVRSLADALSLSEDERASLIAAVPKRDATAPKIPPPVARSPLPSPPTPLLGRQRELTEITELLLGGSEVRLLTLTGVGGVGKTRLAVEVAREVEDHFSDGAAFVSLASLPDPSLVATVVLRSLGLREAEDRTPSETLRYHLRAKRLLLVLDNFEHLLEAAVEVAGLLEGCPGLVVLATSRAPLRVRGEQEYPVPPLALPSSTRNLAGEDVLKAPSSRLFLERARAVSPEFEITQENAGDVAAICWRLAGLPLALELAAAKSRFMEPAALLVRLDRALSTAWTRDLPERQRTMRSTLDWSHDLLTEEERVLFRRLSVFSGGVTLEAAEEVCAFEEIEPEDILELLGRLIEQSLVTQGSVVDGSRYGMLEPVMQYALERLEESGEIAATRERHAEHFVTLAEIAKPVFLGSEYPVWSERLEREHDNLREVLRWVRNEGEVCIGLRIAGALSWFWWMRGYLNEGRRWAEELLSQPFDDDHPTCAPARAGALCAAGELAFGQGDLARAAELFEESLALYRGLEDDAGVAAVLVEQGQVARAQGDHDRAADLSEEGLDLGRALDDSRVAAIALSTLGRVEGHRGNVEGAISHYEESLALFREIGHGWGSAYALANLAVAAHGRGDLERAWALNKESLSIYSGLGDKSGMALVLINLGDVAREQGEEDRAVALYNDALAMHRELGNERGMARALGRLAPRQ